MNLTLKSLIYRHGRSQWEICRELNWPEAKLSRFVTGRRVPSQQDIEALAKVLSLSIEELKQSL
jgi:transcriptional regulator with XRE-family HTH domain